MGVKWYVCATIADFLQLNKDLNIKLMKIVSGGKLTQELLTWDCRNWTLNKWKPWIEEY